MNLRKIKFYLTNLLKYIKEGGVVYTKVAFVQPNQQFVGKNILVTGGSSGIGLEIAKQFLAEGAKVIITGRNMKRLEEVKESLNNENLCICQWNIADVASIPSKLEEVRKGGGGGKIDVFVNNAGVFDMGSWENIGEEMYDRITSVNEKGLFFMCQAEGKYLKNNKSYGKIVNITSINGVKSGFDPYSVSKWGANCITKGLAKELAKDQIIVNAIAPGNVVTNIHEGVRGKRVEDNAYMSNHLTKRYTLVEEVAALTLFLASDSANNIVGQVIAVDGGWTLL